MKKLNMILNENTEVKVDRDWCWISGDTKPIKEDLKSLGFRWSPRRKEWYHRDATSLGVTSDIVEVKAIAKTSEASKKSTSKASKAKTSKSTKASKSASNTRSTYKYGAKRFVRDYATQEELSEILDMIISRISE